MREIKFRGKHVHAFSQNEHLDDDMCNGCPIQECFNRLAEYEDTNLTPGQISEIDKMYQELSKEVMQYRKIGSIKECQAAVEKQRAKKVRFVNWHPVCPECDCELKTWYRFCPDCGRTLALDGR